MDGWKCRPRCMLVCIAVMKAREQAATRLGGRDAADAIRFLSWPQVPAGARVRPSCNSQSEYKVASTWHLMDLGSHS